MLIRKKSGDDAGWSVAVCLRSCTVFDDLGNPNNVEQGVEYFFKGDIDPYVFEVKGSKPKPKPEPLPKEDE